MNILHITPTYYPATYWGGPIFSVYALNNALAKLPNVSLKVLTTDAAGPSIRECLNVRELEGLYSNQQVNMAHRTIGTSISIDMLRLLPGLIRWADVVHLTGTYSFPTIPTLTLCRVFGKPLVWSPRGAIQSTYEWADAPRQRLKRIWTYVCNIMVKPGCTLMHTTSESERIATQAQIRRAEAFIISNGVDAPDMPSDKDWLPNGRLRLIYLGRLSPKKGIENLLHALKLLEDRTITLSIYGTGEVEYVNSLMRLCKELGLLETAVQFRGHIDGADKDMAFHNADVCVVPSHTENFCMVVAEALSHSIPVIASHGTPWADLAEMQCGLWTDNSPSALANAINKIRIMPIAAMGERGRHWMQQEYDWESLAKAMHDRYQSIMAI